MNRTKSTRRKEAPKYPKGKERSLEIILAAKTIFMRDGYSSLTMRNVAKASGTTVGNIQHYFPRKDFLLYELLEYAVQKFFIKFDLIDKNLKKTSDEKLVSFLKCLFSDFNKEDKTKFFPELWALANHDKVASKLMFDVYLRARLIMEQYIADMNKTLTKGEVKDLAIFILSSIEGIIVFAGYEKPWESSLPKVKKYAIRSYLDLIRNTKGSSKRKS